MNHQRTVVAARTAEGAQKAAEIVAAGEGKRHMDAIREKVAEIRQIRGDVVSENGEDARARLLRASLTSLVAGTLGIGAGLIAWWLSRAMLGHQQRERQLVEAKLQAER